MLCENVNCFNVLFFLSRKRNNYYKNLLEQSSIKCNLRVIFRTEWFYKYTHISQAC